MNQSTSVLVTGGTGFFGRAFVRHALNQGVERICIYSRNEYSQHLMRQDFGNDGRLRFFIGDVRDRDRLRRAMEGVANVCHAAALKRIEVGRYDASEMTKTNITGTMNVIEAATDAGVKKALLISSDKAYEPCSPYGQSKALAESLFLNANESRGTNGPLFSVCRWGNVAGSTGSVIPMWRRTLLTTDTVPVTDPDATRFWMRVEHAAELAFSTLRDMKGGETVIPDLPAFRVGDLAEAMGAKVNVVGLAGWEKRHESMSQDNSSDKARRMTVDEIREELRHV